jgi:hypothetical protein
LVLIGVFICPLCCFSIFNVGGVLMIAQKILFAVRAIGCLVCDISGVDVDCENTSYVLTGE